ncbi:MAG: GAF domain-containing protein [Acidobacteria bacterium]|nr:GAF domain-containing protein [Acidobacteriota bacterium]
MNKKLPLLACFFWLGLLFPLTAQVIPPKVQPTRVSLFRDPTYPETRPAIRCFNDRDGLPQNSVMCLEVDQRGYLWAGTQDGATCFNGRSWTTVNMPNQTASNYVRAILPASDGSIWFGTLGGGLSILRNGKWQTFTRQNSPIPNDQIRCLVEQSSESGKSIIWIGTYGGGLVRFENEVWTVFNQTTHPDLNRVIGCLLPSMADDGTPALWVGTYGGGIFRYEHQQWIQYTTRNSKLQSDLFQSLCETRSPDGTQTLWAGTFADGLAKYHKGEWTPINGPETPFASKGIPEIAATQAVDGKTNLWFTTYGGGIVHYDFRQWTVYDAQNSGLPDNNLVAIEVMPGFNGSTTLWVGSNGGGIIRLFDNGWRSITAADVPAFSNRVLALLETTSRTGPPQMWFGTNGSGLVMYQNGKWSVFDISNSSIPNNRVLCLMEAPLSDGTSGVWVGTDTGLACFSGGTWTNYLPKLQIYSLLQTVDASGKTTLWVGTSGDGLARFQDGEWTMYTPKNSGIPDDVVYSLAATYLDGKPTLWLGTNAGLVSFRSNNWTQYSTTNSKLPNNQILHLYPTGNDESSQYLWIGTRNGGAIRINPTDPQGQWMVFSDTSQPSIPNNSIHQIQVDRQGRIFLMTNKGISCLIPPAENLANQTEFSTCTFLDEDGLPSNECTQGAICDRLGRIWAATVNGVAVFSPIAEKFDQTLKPLYIERVTVNGEVQPPHITHLNLMHDQNNLSFEFSLLNFQRSDSTRYRMHLSGYDRIPSAWLRDYKAVYTNLAAGNYTFLVWGKDSFDNITGPISVSIAIKPSLWKTWWAYGLYFVMLVGTGVGSYTWRVTNLRRKQEKRVRFLRQLLESTRIINSKLELTTVLQIITDEAARLVDGEPGGIGLIEGGNVVFRRVWCRDHWDDLTVSFPLGQGIAGRVAKQGTPVIINEPGGSGELLYPDLVEKFDIHGLLNVPIFSRTGKVVGVLDIRRPKGRAPFTEADSHILEALSNQAAVAIENAGLYGELEEKNLLISESMKELQKLYHREQEVTRSLKQLDQMKSNFLAITAHEMRTPITVLSGTHEILLDQMVGALNSEQRELLQTCRIMTERMLSTIEDVQEMLRITKGQFNLSHCTFDLNLTVQDIVTELSDVIVDRSLKINIISAGECEIYADPDKIRQAIWNLVQNAIKFTPNGGRINLHLEQTEDFCHLAVDDSGIGIDPEEHDRIFDCFYAGADAAQHKSGKYEFMARGLGLGLAIVRSYIEAHGGRVSVDSKGRNQGSCFHVWLPIRQQIQEPVESLVEDGK